MALDQQTLDLVENVFKVLEKEGNKVAREGTLPPGKNADKGYDVPSFNAGMRHAMAKIKTGLKQIADGRYTPVEFPRKGQHAVPAPKKAVVAPAKPKTNGSKAKTNGNGKAPAAKKAVRKVKAGA